MGLFFGLFFLLAILGMVVQNVVPWFTQEGPSLVQVGLLVVLLLGLGFVSLLFFNLGLRRGLDCWALRVKVHEAGILERRLFARKQMRWEDVGWFYSNEVRVIGALTRAELGREHSLTLINA
ncbi:hypothetical protein MYX77_12855, partial [Acidobacteriia bacterium AH_259_A11_L15]|nr:hypothetical protein [Acidobacteriia bacterium AH_259_A11_L15]